MSPEFRRIALIVASLGLLVSLFVALRDDGGDGDAAPTVATTTETTTPPPATTTEPPTTTAAPPPPPTPPRSNAVTIRLRVVGGRPVGGIQRPKVKQGRQVTIVTTADVADHIHLHGYDLTAEVAPGRPARIRFRATIPGRFEIELEDRRVQIAELSVTP